LRNKVEITRFCGDVMTWDGWRWFVTLGSVVLPMADL